MKVQFKFTWYDFWIGLYIDQKKRRLYVCPLPTLLFIISY